MFQSAKIASSKIVLWLLKYELLRYVKEKVAHMQFRFSDPYFQCVLEINFGGSVSQLLTTF